MYSVKALHTLVYTPSVLGDTILDKEESGMAYVPRGWQEVNLGPRESVRVALEANLKHCSRSPWANRPAWYSCPSITDGIVSVSCTMTAISLSRFPSMLRSFMLAEPVRRNNETEQPCCRGRHCWPPSTVRAPLLIKREFCSRSREALHNPG